MNIYTQKIILNIAQAVQRWLVTVEARTEFELNSCDIRGEKKSGSGARFLSNHHSFTASYSPITDLSYAISMSMSQFMAFSFCEAGCNVRNILTVCHDYRCE